MLNTGAQAWGNSVDPGKCRIMQYLIKGHTVDTHLGSQMYKSKFEDKYGKE